MGREDKWNEKEDWIEISDFIEEEERESWSELGVGSPEIREEEEHRDKEKGREVYEEYE